MTPPPDDDAPPPPKRRRKPPKGLEGFDTGYPDDDAPPTDTGGVPRKPIWNESTPRSSPTSSSTSTPTPTPPSPTEAEPSSTSLAYEAYKPPATSDVSTRIPTAIPSTPTTQPYAASDPSAGSEPQATSEPQDVLEPYTASQPEPYQSVDESWGAPPSSPDSSSPVPYPSSQSASPYGTSFASTPSGSSNLDREEPLASAYLGTTDADLRAVVGAKSKADRKAEKEAEKAAARELAKADKADKKSKRVRTPPPDLDSGDDFDDDGRPRSRKMIVVSMLSLVVGLGVAALVFLGRANSAWFYISCEPDRIVAQQGRAFPPWGESTIEGKQWAVIAIPPEAECIPLETEDENALSDQFRAMLVKRASVLLTAKEVTKTDEANALLEQALLHARANTDTARDARVEIQRLLGDVVYWRASLKMRDASKALVDAAKQFDAAAQQRPRHVTDAAAWADYVRKVVGELEAGPSGITQTTFPPAPPSSDPRPPAPPGVALPVEPDKGSASEPPPAAPPDAGVQTGGVLL